MLHLFRHWSSQPLVDPLIIPGATSGAAGFLPRLWEHRALAWVREPLARILRRGVGTKVRSSPARPRERRVSYPVCGSIVRLPRCASLWLASCVGVRERRYGQARRDLGSSGFPPPVCGSIVRLPRCASLWPASCVGVRERRYGQARRDIGSGGFPPSFVGSMVRLPGCTSLWLASCVGVRERRYG